MLKDKVIMISGVGPGLGKKMALGAAKHGAKVSISCRTQEYLDELSAEIRDLGSEVIAVKTDITDPSQTQNFVDKTIDAFGSVDALINNAFGGYDMSPLENSDLEKWKEAINIMLYGALHTSKQVIGPMKENGGGSIVMINSMVVRKPLINHSDYATAKAALRGLANSLAVELGPYKIRVNSLYMGWMWGPAVKGFVKQSALDNNISEEEVISGITANIPLGIIPEDTDCANAALFFASDLSKVITGSGLDVNGGEVTF
ncbi:MAG: SDR family oxidoreductase [SAR86 cluster bacterium]|nr:SDR family oxidoreductase [SAR86 cluster bacterium]|tara:strand:+ start:1688 stop:2464 length:777 start_codon:yes stop_codon:yes gene_type:complete